MIPTIIDPKICRFSNSILLEVAHIFYADAMYSEAIERGYNFPMGINICDQIPNFADNEALLREMSKFLVGFHEKTGLSMCEVLDKVCGEDYDEVNELYHLIAGCMGWGVSLADDWEIPDDLHELLHNFYMEGEWWCLADDALANAGDHWEKLVTKEN